MYTVSNEFKENVQSNAVVATARITLVADGTVLDGNNLASVSIKDYCNNNGNIIGTTMCKEAEIEIINNGYDLADKEFLLEVGVEVAEDTIEYIPYGNFVVKEYTDMKSNNRYKIVAYDYMDKLNKEFTDNNTYPMTLQAFYEAFATQYGVQIETQTLPNQEFVVQEKPYFEGATGRTVLSAIAQMFGSFAKFNRNNKLQMYLKNETGEKISRDQMNSKLEIDNRYGPLNTVVLRLGEVEGENVTLRDESLMNLPNGKNLLKNNGSSRTSNGITFTVNEDKSVTINGKNNGAEHSVLYLINNVSGTDDVLTLEIGKEYTVSNTGNSTVQMVFYTANKGNYINKNGLTFTASETDYAYRLVYLQIPKGTATTFNNYTVYPMLVEGTEITSYEPYKPVGEVTLEIVDNPFVYTEELRSKAIQGIYDRVLGFTYIPTSFNYKSYLYLDCGDAVQVQQMKTDNYVDTIILNQEIKVPATRKSKCENLALTKTQVTNQFVSPEKQAQKKTELLVNKQGQEIKALVSKTDAQGAQLTTITANLNGVTTRVESTEERITTAEEDIDNTNQAVSDLGQRVTDEVSNLQGQIDGAIQFWNGPEIPTLNNEPATNWQTEEERNNHRADIYTVIEDVDGEMKQGKSYRFDKVGTEWTWVELTDNELSAVQALAASKAKVFVTTPKPPYNIGDLWLRNEELYECIVKKDANGAFLESDWQKATKYTDDTLAQLAQATADKAIYEQTIIKTTEEGKLFHLPDSADNNCKKVEIFGESTQKTRSGKNKFNINAIANTAVLTNNGDGTLTLLQYYCQLTQTLKQLAPNLKVGDNVKLFFQTTGDKYIYLAGRKATWQMNATITITQEDLDGLIAFYGTQNTEQTSWTISDFMILDAIETDLTYEEFGQMPSREYPSEITSISGKNWLDLANSEVINLNRTEEGLVANLYNTYFASILGNEDLINKFMNSLGKTLVFSVENNYGYFISIVIYGTRSNGQTLQEVSGLGNRIKIKISEDFTAITKIEFRVLRSSSTHTNTTDIIRDVQLEEDDAVTFPVPYDCIGYKSMGQNIFDIEDWYDALKMFNNYYISKVTVDEVEYYKLHGLYYEVKYMQGKFKENTQYTLTFKGRQFEETEVSGTGFAFKYTDGTYSRAWIDLTTVEKEYTIVSDAGKTISFIYVLYDHSPYGLVREVQLVEGTEVKPYEEYKEIITAIPLLHDMRSLNSGVRDRIYYDTKKWYDEQKVNQKIFTGTESWYQFGSNVALIGWDNYSTPLHTDTDLPGYMCNIATEGTASQTENNNTFATYYMSSNTNWIVFNINVAVADWKTYLAERYAKGDPVIVQYELGDPVVSEITDANMLEALESIRTYKGITNIEADTNSILTYYRDVPIVEEYETKANAEKKYKVTEQKFAQQEITNEQITSSVGKLTTTITDNYATKQELESEIKQTSEAVTISINSSIEDLKNKGVPKVVSKIVTIDDSGLTVGASNSQFTNTMNNTGNYQYNAGVLIAKYDKDGAEIPRLKSDYAVIADVKYVKEDISGVTHHRTYILELE